MVSLKLAQKIEVLLTNGLVSITEGKADLTRPGTQLEGLTNIGGRYPTERHGACGGRAQDPEQNQVRLHVASYEYIC